MAATDKNDQKTKNLGKCVLHTLDNKLITL